MLEFVEGGKCRRVVLDEQIDRRTDRIGCEAGEAKCNICQRVPPGVKQNGDSIGNAGRE